MLKVKQLWAMRTLYTSRAVSEEFDLSLLNLIKSRITDETAQSFLEEIRSDDLRKIFDSGLLVNAELDTSSLADFIPESLPNAEMSHNHITRLGKKYGWYQNYFH